MTEEEKSGFKFVDKRKAFKDEEPAKADTSSDASSANPFAATECGCGHDHNHAAESECGCGHDHGHGEAIPPMDFTMLVFSIAGSVQVHLGLIPNPATGKAEVNLPMAKQTIGLIEMLQEKTKGNLTSEEAKLIEHVLYDLRMIYVEKQKGV